MMTISRAGIDAYVRYALRRNADLIDDGFIAIEPESGKFRFYYHAVDADHYAYGRRELSYIAQWIDAHRIQIIEPNGTVSELFSVIPAKVSEIRRA